jgi:hypothetical protein
MEIARRRVAWAAGHLAGRDARATVAATVHHRRNGTAGPSRGPGAGPDVQRCDHGCRPVRLARRRPRAPAGSSRQTDRRTPPLELDARAPAKGCRVPPIRSITRCHDRLRGLRRMRTMRPRLAGCNSRLGRGMERGNRQALNHRPSYPGHRRPYPGVSRRGFRLPGTGRYGCSHKQCATAARPRVR